LGSKKSKKNKKIERATELFYFCVQLNSRQVLSGKTETKKRQRGLKLGRGRGRGKAVARARALSPGKQGCEKIA
jgi:hypothetical protein